MGTRNLTCVYINGEYKVAQYGQWDGQPDGVGMDILKVLLNVDLNNLKQAISECHFATAEEMQQINDLGEMWKHFYPQMSRDVGGTILTMIMFDDRRILHNHLDFAKESLFCEWAYVVDFDSGKFEVYEGFNKQPLTENDRFYFDGHKEDNGYYPVKKIAEFDLDNLPTNGEFLSTFAEDDEE